MTTNIINNIEYKPATILNSTVFFLKKMLDTVRVQNEIAKQSLANEPPINEFDKDLGKNINLKI
ncbi:MAG: hypothetical protein N3A58_01410 [Spirochaetes bacterium]|nr:hypothetical protein [Spirochaetota bacterium]